jgi:hypothetical protein
MPPAPRDRRCARDDDNRCGSDSRSDGQGKGDGDSHTRSAASRPDDRAAGDALVTAPNTNVTLTNP